MRSSKSKIDDKLAHLTSIKEEKELMKMLEI